MADDSLWFSYCDGDVQNVGSVEQLEYHSALNAVVALCGKGKVKVIDASSGAALQESSKSVKAGEKLRCVYHRASESIAVTDGSSLGYRCHNNGVLLLGNILQSPIKSSLDFVTIELPISEARLLSNFIHDSEFFAPTQEAEDGKKAAANAVKSAAVGKLLDALMEQMGNVKGIDNMTLSGKWATVKINLPYAVLKTACQALLIPNQRQQQTIEMRSMIPGYSTPTRSNYGLPIVASMLHQLVLLLPSDNPGCIGPSIRNPARDLMYAELTRRATFTEWPHAFYKYALPDAMAQAGFFHQPVTAGDDRAMCFACNVCLVCWEPSDEPWSEHERHSPSCPFVCCEPTVNVPLSVTHATYPALPNPFPAPEGLSKPSIDFFDVGQNSGLLAAASKNGLLAVWDVNETPQLLNTLSISHSTTLALLRPYLKKWESHSVSELTVTSLHVLDKIPPESPIGTCDPQTFLTSESKPDKTHAKSTPAGSNDAQKKDIPNPVPHKVPTLVLGVLVSVVSQGPKGTPPQPVPTPPKLPPPPAPSAPSQNKPHGIGPGKQSLLVQTVKDATTSGTEVTIANDATATDVTATDDGNVEMKVDDETDSMSCDTANGGADATKSGANATKLVIDATDKNESGSTEMPEEASIAKDVANSFGVKSQTGAMPGGGATSEAGATTIESGATNDSTTNMVDATATIGATTSTAKSAPQGQEVVSEKKSSTNTIIHQFSMLLFVQPARTIASKSRAKVPSQIAKHGIPGGMDCMEDDYYPMPDSAMTNGLGTLSVPHSVDMIKGDKFQSGQLPDIFTMMKAGAMPENPEKVSQQIPNLIDMAMHSAGMEANSSQVDITGMLDPLFFEDVADEMFGLPPIEEFIDNHNEVDIDMAVGEQKATDGAGSEFLAQKDNGLSSVKILQRVAYDFCSAHLENANSPTAESISKISWEKGLKVIDKITTSEDGRKLIITTRPRQNYTDVNIGIVSTSKDSSEMEVNGHSLDQSDVAQESAVKKDLLLPLAGSRVQPDKELARLVSLDLDPADSVHFVKPLFAKSSAAKSIRMSPCVSLLNLPSDFLRGPYQDDYADSMDGEDEEEEQMKEKEGERVGKSSEAESGSPTYILALTDVGVINVVDVDTLDVVHSITATEVFAVTPVNSPETPVAPSEAEKSSNVVANGSPSDQSSVVAKEKFTAMTFCNATERLCVATDAGKLAFLKLGKHSPLGGSSLVDEGASGGRASSRPDGSDVVDGMLSKKSKTRSISPAMFLNSPMLLVNKPLSTETLKGLLQLTKFEPLRPRFTATAPNCWAEVPLESVESAAQQDKAYSKQGGQAAGQQQPHRRHLHHPNQHYPLDMASHSRAWRLQPDCLSWNEHLFELVFPRQTNISHIDLRFVLNSKLKDGANIQVSLIKHPGLTTSKTEMLRNEQRRKWRHHGQHTKHADAKKSKKTEKPVNSAYAKIQHQLTENFVDRLMETNVDSPILFVSEIRQTSDTSVKEYVLMDGSGKEIVCVIAHPGCILPVGNVVHIKEYITCRVGHNMSNIRIVVREAEELSNPVKDSQDLNHAGKNYDTEEIIELDTDDVVEGNVSSNVEESSVETEGSDGDILESQAPPPYSSLRRSPDPNVSHPVVDEGDVINQDGSAVLFGPVSLADYTDASGIGGIVTIASRRLLRDCRHRALLLHFEDASDSQKTGHLGTLSRDDWMKKGCNFLQEISVTVNRIQRSHHFHERAQRVSLFDADDVHEQLLDSVCGEEETETKFKSDALPLKTAALDILNWVAAFESSDTRERKIRLRKTISGKPRCNILSLFHQIEGRAPRGSDVRGVLRRFMEVSFLKSEREVATRSLKLIFSAFLRSDVMYLANNEGTSVIMALAEAAMSCLESAVEKCIDGAFGMYCLFQIMNVVIMAGVNGGQRLNLTPLLERCLSTLSTASTVMKDSIHPLHAMLRAKHGLYGTPFDPDRFVIHSVCTKPKHTKVNLGPMAVVEYASKQVAWEEYFSGEELNVQDLIAPQVLDVRRALSAGDLIDGVPLSRFGLFDCQPLHFTCVSASEGCSVGFDCDFDPADAVPDVPNVGTQPWGPANPLPPKPVLKFFDPDLENQLANMSKISKSLPFKTYKVLQSGHYQTNVGKMAKKVQQDTAVKRHLPLSSKELPEHFPVEEDRPQTLYDRGTPIEMSFPNLSFSLPPLSILTVSRMHSGARRSVVLDLGNLTEVTDVHIASCPELSSLVLDAWSEGTKDGPLNKSVFTHVGMALDICDHDFILSNMSPPVLCRYVKVTIVGRYGTTNAQSRISLGRFYGRPACVGIRGNAELADGSAVPSPPKKSMKDREERKRKSSEERAIVVDLIDVYDSVSGRAAVQRSLAYLHSCQDDVECRYGLACNQLQSMLTNAGVRSSETLRIGDPTMVDSEAALRLFGLSGRQTPSKKLLIEKLQATYYKAIQLQIQMNRITHAIRYMTSILGDAHAPPSLGLSHLGGPQVRPPSYSQLQTYCELMLSMMLSVPGTVHLALPDPHLAPTPKVLIDATRCSEFFQNLCCHGNPRIRNRATCLLLAYSSAFPWWGDFISDTIVHALGSEAFQSGPAQLPNEHRFSVLLALGQRCLAVPPKAENLIKSLLKLLKKLLVPLQPQHASTSHSVPQGALDLNLLTWTFLYVTHVTETVLAHNERFMADATGHVASATVATPPNEAAATVKNNGKAHKIYYNKFTQTPPQAHVTGIVPPTRSSNMKPSASTRETRCRSRWNFIALTEADSSKMAASTSGYMKIFNSIKSVRSKLKHHKSELMKIYLEKKNLVKGHQDEEKMMTDDTTEQVLSSYEVISKLKDLNAKASEHFRGIVGYRRTLDRKAVLSQLNRARPMEGSKPSMGSDSSSWMTAFIGVSVEECRTVVRSIFKLLLSLDFTVPSDFIVLACKLASQLCRWCSAQCIYSSSRASTEDSARDLPQPLCLSELFGADELRHIMLLAVGGIPTPNAGVKSTPGPQLGHHAGPWVNHALLSLLQDILESENLVLSQCEDKLFPDVMKDTVAYWVRNYKENAKKEEAGSSEESKDSKASEDAEVTDAAEDHDDTMEHTVDDDEHEKRITLVDTYLATAEDLLNEIREHMKSRGEFADDEAARSSLQSETPQNDKPSSAAESGVADENIFSDFQKFISEPTKAAVYGPPISKPQHGPAILYNHKMASGVKKAIAKAWWGVPKPQTKVQAGPSTGENVKVRILNQTAASRQLLCSHAYDTRYVHGVSRRVELQQKLCTMAYLKLVSKSIAHPPTAYFKDPSDDVGKSSSDTAQPNPSLSYELLRSCFSDLLQNCAKYSIPLPSLLEVIMLLQNTYKETLSVVSPLSLGCIILLSEDGVKALISAVNSDHGNSFHDNPQTWSLVLSLLKGSIQPSDSLLNNGKFFQELFSPESGLVKFFTKILSYKMVATNVSANNFNQGVPLLGPSVELKFKELLKDYRTMASFYDSVKELPKIAGKNMIHLYRDTLLLTLAELAKRGDLEHTSAAPTDVQLSLVNNLNELFTNDNDQDVMSSFRICWLDTEVVTSIVRNVAGCAHRYLQWSETAIKGKSDGVDPRMCMSGLFSSIVRPSLAPNLKNAESPRDALMLGLLKLCSELVTIIQPDELAGSSGSSPASVEMADAEPKHDEAMEVENNSSQAEDSEKKMAVDEPENEDQSQDTVRTIADLVLADEDTMHTLLSCLAVCNSSAMTSIFSGLNLTSALAITKSPISTGGGVFALLSSLVRATCDEIFAVRAVFNYVSCGVLNTNKRYEQWHKTISSTCQLSVPLLWFILHVLETPDAVNEFCCLGGAKLIADSLVTCARETVDRSPGRTSQMLRYLTAASDRANALAPRPPVVLHHDTSWPSLGAAGGKVVPKLGEGLGPGFNYMSPAAPGTMAPPGVKVLTGPVEDSKMMDFSSVATIECDDNSSPVADSLLKPKAVQRRSRSPSWSYHFTAERQWVALTLHFPVAFVLKDVQLHPMLVSLTNTPSCVVLETNRTGAPNGSSYHPVSVPLAVGGQGEIRIHPPTEEVVTSIRIHMKRPVDSSSIGLTRIIVHGIPTFMNYDHVASRHSGSGMFCPDSLNLPADTSRRSAMNWLRLLHHCMTVDEEYIKPQFIDAVLTVADLIPTLCTLLQLTQSALYTTTIEDVLIETGASDYCPWLIDCLLRGSCAIRFSAPQFLGSQTNNATESSINILYELALIKDADLGRRIERMLKWTETCAVSSQAAAFPVQRTAPSSSHIHAIACALWANSDSASVKSYVTQPMVQVLYTWSQSLCAHASSGPTASAVSSPLKSSLDWLLCSFCNTNTECYVALLNEMGLLKQGEPIILTPSQLDTLSVVSQSPECLKVLKSKGILQGLCQGLNSFCCSVMEMYGKPSQPERSSNSDLNFFVSLDNVIAIISLFSNLCDMQAIQDWLGSDEGEKTWSGLLQMLCHILPVSNTYPTWGATTQRLPRYLLLDLQESTIVLIKRLTTCHMYNQQLFTKALCDIVSSEAGSPDTTGQLSGFVRSLLLRVVLEDEQYTVRVDCCSKGKLHKGKSNSSTSGGTPLRHPMFATGHSTRTFEVGISSNMRDIRAMASDAPSLMEKLEKQKDSAQKAAKLPELKKNSDKKENSGTDNNNSNIIKQTLKAQMKMKYSMSDDFVHYFGEGPPPNVTISVPKGGASAMAIPGIPFGLTTLEAKPPPTSFVDHVDQIIAMGKKAQEKRNPNPSNPVLLQAKELGSHSASVALPSIYLRSRALPFDSLDNDLTLLKLLAMLKASGSHSFGRHVALELVIPKPSKSQSQGGAAEEEISPVAMETNTPEAAALNEQESEQGTSTSNTSLSVSSLERCDPLKTMLEVFASLGGLALVAQRLPTVTLEGPALASDASEKPGTSSQKKMAEQKVMGPSVISDQEWLICQEEEEDMFGFDGDSLDGEQYEDAATYIGSPYHHGKTTGKKEPHPHSAVPSGVGHPCVPSHTMSALCLFLRVPFFAEEFLSKQKQARCLLRLMLGVLDDGLGEPIMKLELAQSLPMLPFSAIRSLLGKHHPGTNSGIAVRKAMTFDTTSLHLVLACLSRFTHNEPSEDTPAGRLLASLLPEQEPTPINVAPPSYKGPTQAPPPNVAATSEAGKQGEKNYWAKGTGFGTGSTTSDWDVGDAVKKQKKDEGYITVLLEVLANFVCPERKDDTAENIALTLEGNFGTVIPELIIASGLIPAIASYLRNDSVLDMAHHVPLYNSLLGVIRAFAVCPILCRLLMDSSMTSRQTLDGTEVSKSSAVDSVLSLLTKMRKCIDTYASRLKAINTSLDSQGEEGLTDFVTNVQNSETMLRKIADELRLQDSLKEKENEILGAIALTDNAESMTGMKLSLSADSLEHRYVEEMKSLQFDTAELVIENDDGKLTFPSGHHYSSLIKDTANLNDASRARRLAQETVTLSNSLPLSHSSTVFVRCDEERLDVMKVLITGPSDTPYANGCFEFDVFFPGDYNRSPPLVNLLTNGNHSVRFNPNLYNDGKVCLSILNTWHGRPEEKWNPHTSSFLQILVSIQSLILVSEPYFNEPGYERSRGTLAGKQSSREYDANIQQATVKWAMLEQLRNPSPCFKEVIERHFWLKRNEILSQCQRWGKEMEQQSSDRHARRTILHNCSALQRHTGQLRDILMKMKCPEGLEDTQCSIVQEQTDKPKTASKGQTESEGTSVEIDNVSAKMESDT